MTMTGTFTQGDRPNRELQRAWWCFGGTFIALVASGIWSLFVGTSSPGADESDLVQGWEGVARNLPAYALLVIVPALGVWFATRAGIHGSGRAMTAVTATCAALLLALSSVTRDATEVVMTTRAAGVVWVAFAADACIVAATAFVSRRTIRLSTQRATRHD